MWDKDQFRYLAQELEIELKEYDRCSEATKKRHQEVIDALKLLDKLLNYPKGRSEPEQPENDSSEDVR